MQGILHPIGRRHHPDVLYQSANFPRPRNLDLWAAETDDRWALSVERFSSRTACCGFRRSRPGIPSIIRAPFHSDGAHHSNLMAPGWCRLVGQLRHVMTVKLGSSDSALFCRLVPVLITAVTSGWFDLGECCEIEVDNGLECLRDGTVAEAVRKCGEPIGVFGLQCQQLVDRVTPAPGAAPSVRWSACLGCDGRRLRRTAGPMASLALSVAQRVLALWFTASGHGPVPRYVTHDNGLGSLGDTHRPPRGLRRVSPLSSIRCALWMIRSRIASANVGLPTISYQRSIGTWLVMISEPAP
jgi:hypothetical protein